LKRLEAIFVNAAQQTVLMIELAIPFKEDSCD
jgi:hypothetical protein